MNAQGRRKRRFIYILLRGAFFSFCFNFIIYILFLFQSSSSSSSPYYFVILPFPRKKKRKNNVLLGNVVNAFLFTKGFLRFKTQYRISVRLVYITPEYFSCSLSHFYSIWCFFLCVYILYEISSSKRLSCSVSTSLLLNSIMRRLYDALFSLFSYLSIFFLIHGIYQIEPTLRKIKYPS